MRAKRTATIFTRVFMPLFLVMLLQSAIFYFVTVFGHTVSALDSNATDVLSERVDNRQNEIETLLTSKWGNMSFYSDSINRIRAEYSDRYQTPLYSDRDQQRAFLGDISDTLFRMLRNNAVNGVFVILTNSREYKPPTAEAQSFYGLCIRDYDINSGYTDKEDLLLLRNPSSLNTMLGCSLDSYWEAVFTFGDETSNGDFFYKPLKAAYENPGSSAYNFKYFCGAHTYGSGDRPVVSYTIPLIDDNNDIYGVMGVEVMTSHIASLLPSNELLGLNKGAYMLVQHDEGSSDFEVIATRGTAFKQHFGDISEFSLDLSATVQGNGKLIEYMGKQNTELCCYVSPLSIYNENTPFENETVSLIGAVEKADLFSVSSQVRNALLVVTISVLAIGFAAIFLVSHFMTRPIKKLAAKVQKMEPDDDAELGHIEIAEIDRLIDAIENQSRRINQTKVRTEFLSRMSHDMRTPMNAIIGFSSPEITKDGDRGTLLEYLNKINGSGKYLLSLINEVLDMTKIDSGKMELDNKEFCIDDLWSTTISMIDELALRRKIHFEKRLPPADGLIVIGDAQRLSQVLVNLLSNAVKFSPEGGRVILDARQSTDEPDKMKLAIKVIDKGVGMSEEFQKKLYMPFEQEHSGREGTGLGLSIAHQLISLMDGAIDCESKLGEGTTFTLRLVLPLAKHNKASGAETTNLEQSEAEIDRILKGRRVLLCEDHPMNQQIASRVLTMKGMKVEIADNGKVCCEMFAASQPNYYEAILMDIRMPVMDGLEATEEIRKQQRPDAKTVPIIAMTANAFSEDINAAIAAGMNAHSSKPIETQKLYALLAFYINERDKESAP